MKQIKFKVWDKTTETMFTIDGEKLINADLWNQVVWLDDSPLDYENGEEAELLQYTGLKDKNNKEIYEGDILKESNGDLNVCIYIDTVASYGFVPDVIYKHNYEEDDENIDFLALAEQMYEEYGTDCFPKNLEPKKYLEVIGNIYESPELLEEK